ncbi:MAG: hypothetical protein CMI09_01700 [Oceanospirillaceae bacterium]|nr:hypothetical protein [Oceanospirillaceae bacterium]|tara:strand:+ start:484 stop:1464 length:981 start_codon:yes stop_codon:yes gene_type:complete
MVTLHRESDDFDAIAMNLSTAFLALLFVCHTSWADVPTRNVDIDHFTKQQINWLYAVDLSEGQTQVRVKLASSNLISALVIWNSQGERLYPQVDASTYFDDHGVTNNLHRMRSLLSTAQPTAWERQDVYSQALLHCRSDGLLLCVQLNTDVLSADLNLSRDMLLQRLFPSKKTSNPSLWLLALMAMITMAVLALFLFRSKPTQQYASSSPCPEPKTEPATASRLRMGDMIINPRQMTIQRQQLSAPISPRDLKLLNCFCQRPDEVISKDELYNIGWGRDFMPSSRALEQHILNLRRKIDPERSRPILIETVHGQGYRFPSDSSRSS